MKLTKYYFRSIALFGIFALTTLLGEQSVESDVRKAVLLAHDFVEKLKENTPFTYDDGLKFFGAIPTYNMHTMVYIDSGYISENGKWLKPKPVYSLLGELIRTNRHLFLQENPSPVAVSYFVGKRYSVLKNNKVHPWWMYNITIESYTYSDQDRQNQKSLEKTVTMEYVPEVNALELYNIKVDDLNIMEELGFYRSDTDGRWKIKQKVVRKILERIEQIEK